MVAQISNGLDKAGDPYAVRGGDGITDQLLAGLAWVEIFVGLGLHCFWVMFKSSPLGVDNATGEVFALAPLLVLICAGACAGNRRIEGALIRLEPLFHWTACLAMAVLVFYVVLHDPFQAVLPLSTPMLVWSVGLSFALAANLSTHLRLRAVRLSFAFTASSRVAVLLAAAWWCAAIWLASGTTWAVYFWTASIMLHGLLAVVGARSAGPALSGRPHRVTGAESLATLFESLFLLGLVLIVLVRGVYIQANMGGAEEKYLMFLTPFRAPAFFAGALLFLFAARERFVPLAHMGAAGLLVLSAKEQAWPLAFLLGYGLPALFSVTRRQGGLGYALSGLLMIHIWQIGLAGFLFSGLIVHFKYGIEEIDIVLQWGVRVLFVLLALTIFGMLAMARRKREADGFFSLQANPISTGSVLCGLVFVVVLLVAAVPGAVVLFKTAWPPMMLDRPLRQAVGEPMGLCHAGYSASEEEYRILDELGVQCLRADFAWTEFQPGPDQWNVTSKDGYVDAAVKRGKQVVAILDYDNNAVEQDGVGKSRGMYIAPSDIPLFLEYARRLVTHYKGRVYAWEIWNEPDMERFWAGSMEEFYELARQTAEAIRGADDKVQIIGTAMTGSFGVEVAAGIEGLHRSGALAVADHPSNHLYATDPSHYYMDFQKIIGAARRHGHPGPVWITELGAPDGGYYPWGSDTEQLAEHVIKAYTIATSLGMDKLVWYCFRDAGLKAQEETPIEAERFFGLLGPDDKWKPSAHAYRLFSRACSYSTIRADLVKVTGGLAARQLRTALYRRNNGESALVLWFEPKLRPRGIARVQLDLGKLVSPAVAHDIGSDYEKALLDDHIDVTDKPVVITYKAAGPEDAVHITATTSPVDGLWLLLVAGMTIGSGVVCFRGRA